MKRKVSGVLYRILNILPTIIVAFGVIFNSQFTNASTTVDYSSPCKYFNAQGKLKFSGTCQVNFGTLGVQGGARFIMTFPNGAEVIIYDKNQIASANNIPADIAIAGGNIVVTTDEGEIFIFKESPFQ